MLQKCVAVLIVLACATGCTISHEIVEVEPPRERPSLQNLEQHLTYNDPDRGASDYIIE